MQEEFIDAALNKVVVEFSAGRMRPIFLEWSGRRWPVRRVNSIWRHTSPPRRTNFSLTMESGDVFRVSYEEARASWRLEAVMSS